MLEKPTKQELTQIPPIQKVLDIPVNERIIYLRFSIGECEWLVAGYDGADSFYGFVDMHQPLESPEWKLFSYTALREKRIDGQQVEYDPYWQPILFADRPINLTEVILPSLLLTCGNCGSSFNEQLPLVIAWFKVRSDCTPCCGKDGWFREKGIVAHIKALLK